MGRWEDVLSAAQLQAAGKVQLAVLLSQTFFRIVETSRAFSSLVACLGRSCSHSSTVSCNHDGMLIYMHCTTCSSSGGAMQHWRGLRHKPAYLYSGIVFLKLQFFASHGLLLFFPAKSSNSDHGDKLGRHRLGRFCDIHTHSLTSSVALARPSRHVHPFYAPE